MRPIRQHNNLQLPRHPPPPHPLPLLLPPQTMKPRHNRPPSRNKRPHKPITQSAPSPPTRAKKSEKPADVQKIQPHPLPHPARRPVRPALHLARVAPRVRHDHIRTLELEDHRRLLVALPIEELEQPCFQHCHEGILVRVRRVLQWRRDKPRPQVPARWGGGRARHVRF
ncbi:hypothetical protein OE88DRAFT_929611 [Heliocybe sulcata]|uniref:Uncharacterized protein n=1 Tax=Heliocybe sulcata TaxID=5364 RepID=A0A5C3MLN1_9AGAM|nr:hypothetical protein OE88DRAFT_929611 [Heliocybe sulcata]